MEKSESKVTGTKKDNFDPQEDSASESSPNDSDSSFDENDVDDVVEDKRTKRNRRAAKLRKVPAKNDSSNASSESSIQRRTRLSQKIEEGIPLHLNSEMQNAYKVLQHVMSDANQSYNWPFLEEVNVNLREYRNYTVVVEKPMWLNKVKERLLSKEYPSITEVVRDIRLVFENCYRFHGATHSHSKKGFRLEAMLEVKLAQLPRDLRDKTAIAVTSHELVKGVNPKELEYKPEYRCGPEASCIMTCVKYSNDLEEAEEKRLLELEKEMEKDPAHMEVLEWESKLIGEHETALKAMWELPQIGHFLFLAQSVLNIPEVSQFELERVFFMPQASSLLSVIMTALLSSPRQRPKLVDKPPMPYRIWHERLKVKVQTWYKLYYTKERNVLKVLDIMGIEPQFFRIMGDINPLEKRPFHELQLYERVWLVKSLCDFCLHNHKSVQEAMFQCDPLDHQETILGEDVKGNVYLHFPQFCGQDLRVYRQAPHPVPTAPDLSCPPIEKELTNLGRTAGTSEPPVTKDAATDKVSENETPTDATDAKSEDIVAQSEKDSSEDTHAKDQSNCAGKIEVSARGESLQNGLNSECENSVADDNSKQSKECSRSVVLDINVNPFVNGDSNPKVCEAGAELPLDSLSNKQKDDVEINIKPKLIMKLKKEINNFNQDDDTPDSNDRLRRKKHRSDIFKICIPDTKLALEEPAGIPKEDGALEDSKDESTTKEDCEDNIRKRLRGRPKNELAKEETPLKPKEEEQGDEMQDSKLGEDCKEDVQKKLRGRPKKFPSKPATNSEIHLQEVKDAGTCSGSKRKGKRGRKIRVVPVVISYDAVPSKPDIEEFELVVHNLDTLRELTESFMEKEQPTRTRLRKREQQQQAQQQKGNGTEKSLHKRLCNLLEELETWELTLKQTTKGTRLRMKKEWEDYQTKAALQEEEECNDIWGSEDEDEDDDIQANCSSSSSSNSEAEYEDLGDATSFRIQHLRQCTRKKRVRGEYDRLSTGVESENSNSSEAVRFTVSSRGRIRKVRRLDNYENQQAQSKASPSPKRQYIVLNGIQPDQRNMLEAHRIQNSAQDAKMQYQWETMRQQLLEQKLKKAAAQAVPKAPPRYDPKSCGIDLDDGASRGSPTIVNVTPRVLPHYGERSSSTVKSMEDPTTLPKESGVPASQLQHVLLSQPSFGSMKSMKSSLSSEDSNFYGSNDMGFQPYIPDLSTTHLPYRPPPEATCSLKKKTVIAQPKTVRSESKNIGKRLLHTSYTAPGILKTTVGSKVTTPEKPAAVRLVTTNKTQSQVLRLQLPPSIAADPTAIQQKRVVLVPVKDSRGGSRYILKVLPPTTTVANKNVTGALSAASTFTTSNCASTSSAIGTPQTVQNSARPEHRKNVPVNSTPPPLGPIAQTFQKMSPTQPNGSPAKAPEPPPLTLILPQHPTSPMNTQQQLEIVNQTLSPEMMLPPQQQVVISQPMIVPCPVQMQTTGGIFAQQQVVCTSNINGLLQLGKQLVITQPNPVTTNNIVLLTSNNQVISSTLNLPGS